MKKQESGFRNQEPEACVQELHAASCILHPEVLQRVRWRCRRGLLELDLIFRRFVDTHYAGLTEEERQIFDELLDMPDNPLWDLISGKTKAATDAQNALLLKINSL